MIEFETKVVDLGDPIEKNSVHKVVYPFKGSKDNIIHVQPGCSCTANVDVFDDRIEALFTESSAKNLTEDQIKKQFPSGLLNFSKTIKVYLKDDQDLYVEEGMNKVYNQKK